jgi:hypothetical protein
MSTGSDGEVRGRGMTKLHDRVALVTGSSRGIGAAIASLFAIVSGGDDSLGHGGASLVERPPSPGTGNTTY